MTTLNDSGPGSLRAALEEQRPRIVVFRVAGIIQLASDLDLDNPDITIAGQSGPGDGICLAGNVVEGFPDVTADNWKGMQGPEETARVNTPFEGWPVRQETAPEALQSVLARAGTTLPRRDAVDARIIEVVRTGAVTTGNGIINDPKEVGGFPDYSFAPGDVPADTDHDGMPDVWEKKYDLNPADASDNRLDSDQDGYTNVEEYLNGTNPREKIDYRNLANNVDTIS